MSIESQSKRDRRREREEETGREREREERGRERKRGGERRQWQRTHGMCVGGVTKPSVLVL